MKFVCFGNKVENLEISKKQKLIGSKKKYFLNKFEVGDRIALYAGGKIYAYAYISSSGFYDNSEVWPDYDYPFRFKIDSVEILSAPYEIVGSPLHTLFKEKYGRGWAFKILFTPTNLPKDIYAALLEHTEPYLKPLV